MSLPKFQSAASWFVWLLLLPLSLSLTACDSGEEEETVAPQRVLREGPPPLENPNYMSLGTFVVNMPDGKYYLKTSIELAFDNPVPMEWMSGRMPLVKDMVIRYLQGVDVNSLDDARFRQIMKNDLQIRLNSLFPNEPPWEDPEPVKRILFTEFYKQ